MEMKEINKIVQLSDLQYEKLLKDRQIEIDGEIKVWEPDTLYVTPNNNYQWLFNKFYETAVKPNEVYHNPMNMKSLEQEYEDLIIENENLTYLSAIGYTAILKNGDTIKVTKPNKGIFYINGIVRTNDYTYTGDGYEVVNVWCFENDYELILNDEPTFSIQELNIKNLMTTPVVGNSYTLGALILEVYNYKLSTFTGSSAKKFVVKGVVTYNQLTIGQSITEVESDCTQIDYSVAKNPFDSRQVKKIILPEVTSIFGMMFQNTNWSYDVEIYTPKLTSVNGSGNNHPYQGVKNVIIPNSVRVVGTHVCAQNDTITLNCNRATINSSWCTSAPKVNFTMCDDWQASINIAVAAKNHTIDWFIDLFTNKLADMTGQDAPQINIPLAIFEALSPEQLAIARNKNWTVTGS